MPFPDGRMGLPSQVRPYAPASNDNNVPTSRGYNAPTSRGYNAPTSRGYNAPTSRGYNASTSRGYNAPTSRGYNASTSRSYDPSTSRGYNAPTSNGHTNTFARDADPKATELPVNEAASQWPLGNVQPSYQGRKLNKPSNASTRQQYTFPSPPNQPPMGVSGLQPSPAAREYEPTPPPSSTPSRIASSRASTVSSIGSIPDFPLPQIPAAVVALQRKSQNMNPPPSARRPGPTYLTRDSFVTPIEEESPEPSPRRAAFAGAAASSQGSRVGANVPSRSAFLAEKGESDVQHISTRDDATRLIRQAGRDQQAKPELVIINSRTGSGDQQSNSFRFPFASPRSSSEYELEVEKPPLAYYGSRSRSPLLSPDDGLPSPISEIHFEPRPAMSDKLPSNRRPPRLDLDTVKESEARGSLTSLPDLIRRATKLAANLDRGKTASRLGMLDMFSNPEKLSRDKTDAQSTTGSMSDMLSAFPVPGTTPTLDNLTSDYASTNKNGAATQKKSGRRCCGMSIWVFSIICLVLLILVAAAVLVPIFLIVIPEKHQSQHEAASQAALNDCSASLPCSNGGVSLISSDVCSCICVNGFTGAQCTTGEDPGCVTTDVASDVTSGSKIISNATMGSSIPRLLAGSQSYFNIQLNSTSLLSLFSANSLSCTSENALVTFNSQSLKVKRFYIVSEEEPMPDKTESHVPRLTGRAKTVIPIRERRAAETATSAGIVFQQSTITSTVASQTVTYLPSSTPSAIANGPSSSESPDTLDFARLVVLYVLEQTSDLDAAIMAQQSMQDLFLQSTMNTTLPLNVGGLNVTANFDSFTLKFGNGTEVGGKGNGQGGLSAKGKK